MMTFLQSSYSYNASEAAMSAGLSTGVWLLGLLLYLFYGFCLYKIFQKAGVENPWMAFIPVIMYLPQMQIAKKPMWWIVLLLIPFVNLVVGIIIWMRIAKAFGKSDLYGIALVFFAFIMLPVFAFSDAQYHPEAISDDTGKSL